MNTKIITLSVILFGFVFGVHAQNAQKNADHILNYAVSDTTQGWKHSGVAGINFGQTSLTNWSAGGDHSTFSGNFYLNGALNYLKDKWSWDNSLVLEYGTIYSSTNDWQKSSDKILLTSMLGRRITSKWSYAFLFDFNTQFAKGYDYPNKDYYISTFMAPAYSNLALGFTYKPNTKYALFLSPITARMIFVLDDSLSSAGAFGVDPGDKFKLEPGAYVVATTTQSLITNVNLISRLDMFTPYDENFGNVDINWDMLLSFKVNKLLTTTLKTTVRYYDNEIKRVQFKEILGLGLAYQF